MNRLHPIKLPFGPPESGAGYVHCYAVQGDEKLALVDTGVAGHFDVITAGLAELGKTPADVDLIINTHEHPDHAGGNGLFANQFNTPIIFHTKAARWIENMELQKKERGAPAFDDRISGSTKGSRYLEEGDEIDLGEILLEVVYLPGHSNGQIGLFCKAAGWLLAADAVVPVSGRPIYADINATLATIDKIDTLDGLTTLYNAHNDTPFTGEQIGIRLQEGRAFVAAFDSLVQKVVAALPDGDDEAHTRACLDELGFAKMPTLPMLVHTVQAHKRRQ